MKRAEPKRRKRKGNAMPQPAPKPLEEELSLLVKHLSSGQPLGDIRRFNIEKKLEACLESSTADAYYGLALLAAIDRDYTAMRDHLRSLFACVPGDPGYEFNFGLLLMLTDNREKAIKLFMQSLDHGLRAPNLLDALAENALILGDPDLQLKVLERAARLQCEGPCVLRLAALVSCANSDDPDEQDNLLSLAFPDDDLKANSEPVTDQEWLRMQSFADDLRKYL